MVYSTTGFVRFRELGLELGLDVRVKIVKTTLLKIQRITNMFIRMIHGIHYKGSVENAMCINGLITVEQIQQLETTCFMFKYSKNLLPNSFANFF